MTDITTDIEAAVAALQKGGVIAYPTETIYGLGCDAMNSRAVGNIFRLKGRPAVKALPVLVSSPAMLKQYFVFSSHAQKLARRYWPGPLSLLLDFNDHGKQTLQARINPHGEGAVVRISSHPIARQLVKKLGRPLVSTSANPAGRPPALSAQEVHAYFKNRRHKPDIILDAGELAPSLGSTIVDARGKDLKVIRQGDLKLNNK